MRTNDEYGCASLDDIWREHRAGMAEHGRHLIIMMDPTGKVLSHTEQDLAGGKWLTAPELSQALLQSLYGSIDAKLRGRRWWDWGPLCGGAG